MRVRSAAVAVVGIGAAIALAACSEEQQPISLLPGQPCDPAGDNFCNGGFCLRLDSATGVCSVSCTDDASCSVMPGATCQVDATLEALVCKPGFRCESDPACPAGHRCDVGTGTCYIPVERGLCSPCTADPQCPEGSLCLRARGSGERFCTAPCEDEAGCPDGFLCREVAQDGVAYDGTENPKQCVPRSETCNAGKPLCAPCRGDDECGDGNDACVENLLTGEKFCGISCNPACVFDEASGTFVNDETGEECRSVCPENFTCTSLGGDAGPFQCVPNAGTCEGYCTGGSEASDLQQCGFGRSCDVANHECAPATDGRQCAPCTDDDSCNPPGSTTGASCLVNQSSGETFCAIPCGADVDCDEALGVGFSCLEVEGRGRCVPDRGTCTSGVGRLGDDCTAAGPDDCLTGVCLQFGAVGLCSASCSADADCADARYRCCALRAVEGGGEVYDCDAALTATGVCAPLGGGFGDDCEPGQPPCQDGHCLDIGTARLCTASCQADADCDARSGTSGQFACSRALALDETGAPTEDVNVCFPAGGGEPGSDCSFGPAACADRLCIKKESGNVCTKACDDGSPCPGGWTCGPATTVDGLEVTICLPPAVAGGESE